MKTTKIFVCSLCIMFMASFTIVNATENPQSSLMTITYLDDGSYYVTTITEEKSLTRASSTKTGTKTTKYVNSSGEVKWQVSVTGTFSYNNSTSSCTKAIANATSYSSAWSISNKYANKSSNKATATATAKHIYNTTVLETTTKSVTLSCSPKGVLS